MEKTFILTLLLIISMLSNSSMDMYSLTVKIDGLKNSEGSAIFALYNKEGSIPDEKFKNYYIKKTVKIVGGKAVCSFKNLQQGRYAIAVLHDENNNGKLDKKIMLPLPVEGIGFSNYTSIGLSNRPNFTKASFELDSDTTISVKMIYK
ncbi:DUF2141 domain-containing protein [Maribacter polysaccharolyticus]|uniref:DUF2141 domain-containing protein n=1 Tax=Maribacter polysaccharolyticus TaxID=3020831 RepID=UPI00237F0FBF|nr:DUF2141 domain-containing protein [Maribacter polysaccharolyticus]MDE3741129.1 DUF2141 domain-containing protein [Maribacter polysaccharolyticus]